MEHIARHGIETEDAERVVRIGVRRKIGKGEYKAIAQNARGIWMQAIYIFDPPGIIYVIHARPLTDAEKHRVRRNLK